MSAAPSSGLISAKELHGLLDDPLLRIADVRWYLGRPGAGRTAYDEGHIPGAIFLDLDTDLSDEHGYGAPGRHPLPSPPAFARTLGALGISTDSFVVAYDDLGGTIAARLWWMLDDLGHRGGVAVLNGGIQGWQAAGFALSRGEPRWPPTSLVPCRASGTTSSSAPLWPTDWVTSPCSTDGRPSATAARSSRSTPKRDISRRR